MMKKILEFIKWFFYITTSVVFICAANLTISGGNTIFVNTLWQILLCGFLTALVTVLLRPGAKDGGKIMMLKIIIHYIILCVVMIICGHWFGWMVFSFADIVMMLVSVAVVYLIVFTAGFWLDLKGAEEINRRLKEKYNDKE
ncbi:MAG: DUF3021 family protein [Lachnospiraceae bacterium]|nr:DUF3021 family protein [Lachnospiraceae bacterium]